ncbi:MAG: adenosine kinase [Rhodospirillaceae bacterium]
MAGNQFDVVGIGNAIVDVLSHAEDSFIAAKGLAKGSMNLIDQATADALYKEMGPGIEASGGSAGNTMAGVASLGGRGAYIGKVANDTLGEIFRHDIKSVGLNFDTAPLISADGPSTARCLILVSPDAERTMNTFLGACTRLAPEDIDGALIAQGSITYVEGYLWDLDAAKQAIVKAADVAHEAGQKFSLTLSDSFCVMRHKAEFLDLIRNKVDILFANEAEITALFDTDSLDTATAALKGLCQTAALTRSGEGCRMMDGETILDIPAQPVATLVDTTGAGDQFAAGVLTGLAQGASLERAGQMGTVAAAEVISHFGARPEVTSLKALVEEKLGPA